ncbi:hypothetical protein SPAR10_0577 [Streptococcus infantis SPAR10]|uniref:Uncharacterized protein n=1 Tax=Streptococcus infantis SPAR10 TaxID=1159208 RepID=J1SE89_9STRE|nr:hypothetical protein SPAR10_0577 [Streptococcus infantis SPAR10]
MLTNFLKQEELEMIKIHLTKSGSNKKSFKHKAFFVFD